MEDQATELISLLDRGSRIKPRWMYNWGDGLALKNWGLKRVWDRKDEFDLISDINQCQLINCYCDKKVRMI